jgi:hypothetical protein
MAYGTLTVGTSAVVVPSTTKVRTIYNAGAVPVYLGDDASVTTATGTPIQPGGNWKRGPLQTYLIAGTAGQNVTWVTEDRE